VDGHQIWDDHQTDLNHSGHGVDISDVHLPQQRQRQAMPGSCFPENHGPHFCKLHGLDHGATLALPAWIQFSKDGIACSTHTCHWSSCCRAVEQQVQPGNVLSAQIEVNTRPASTHACTDQVSGIDCKVFAEHESRSPCRALGRTACALRTAGTPRACHCASIDVPMHALPTLALALHDTHCFTMPGC